MNLQPTMRPGQPPTVKELVVQAEGYAFNTNIPLKNWIRTAETLYQEAMFAMADGNFGRAYIMLYRHSELVVTHLRTHPEFKDPEGRRAVKPLIARIDRVIQELQNIKPEIEAARKEWERMQPPRPPKETRKQPSSYAEFAAQDPTLTGNAKILDASQHQDLAVDLAQKELQRRDTIRRTSRKDGHSYRTTSIYRQPSWQAPERPPKEQKDDDDLRSQMEATRNNLDRAREGRAAASDSSQPSSSIASSNYHYPSISKSRPVELQRDIPPEKPSKFPALVPDRPPKESLEASPFATELATTPALPPKTSISGPPVPKKERLTFKPGAYLENGDPIRSLFIPSKLRQSFLDIASKNTAAGLEMCGVLCGTPVNNALFVRCLLIPDQTVTSDTCETENEGTMAEYCMNEDLMILGWIHTHPTQTCFMSSRDLHTHAGYQVMMPESVAVVCAPKFSPS
ncbi:hypothetical protein K4F52_004594 [Lecanicillium sp. MT-2017a]|nr:hypothetical protein K4F52_004594 [Lecanicillium sp. MT-2017a]